MLDFIIKPSRDHRRLGQLMLLLTLGWISFLVFSQPGGNYQPFTHFDKLAHFGAFFLLAALLQLATNWKLVTQLGLLFSYAAVIEIVQSRLPYRSADPLDLLADIVGALTFYLLLINLRYWKTR